MAHVADATGPGSVEGRAADSDGSRHQRPVVSSRGPAIAWLIAALVVSLLLGALVVAMPLPQVVAVVGSGACIAQARRHSGREPRWVVSLLLGALMTMAVTAAVFAITIAIST